MMNRLVIGVAVVAIFNPFRLPAQGKTNLILDKVTSELVAAFNAEDAARAALLYAEDAVLMPANMPMIKGRAAIEGHFKKEFAATDMTLQLKPIESTIEGSQGFGIGTSALRSSAAGRHRQSPASEWSRQASMSWCSSGWGRIGRSRMTSSTVTRPRLKQNRAGAPRPRVGSPKDSVPEARRPRATDRSDGAPRLRARLDVTGGRAPRRSVRRNQFSADLAAYAQAAALAKAVAGRAPGAPPPRLVFYAIDDELKTCPQCGAPLP